MQLCVDGTLRASNPQVATRADYTGYWHVGGGQLAGWYISPGNPSSEYFNGQIDETAVYPSVLSPPRSHSTTPSASSPTP